MTPDAYEDAPEISHGPCFECDLVIARQHLVWFSICAFCLARVVASDIVFVHRRFFPASPEA